MRSSVLVFAVSLLTLPATAQAHFTILTPPPASKSTNGGKGDPPCGPTDMPSNVVTPAQGGHLLKINVDETTYHKGFYRIALALNSRSELPPDNVVRDANNMILLPTSTAMSFKADFDAIPKFPVLADDLWDHSAKQPSTYFVTEADPSTACMPGKADPVGGPHCVYLPNVTCEKCTLQVIEFMADHPSNGAKAGYFYHHCVDLKITADPSLPAFSAGGTGAGGGSSGGASGASGSGSMVAGSGGTSSGGGGTGGSTAGTASTSIGGSASAGAPPTAGAPAIAGSSSTGGSNASTPGGANGTPNSSEAADSGGCAVSNHSAGSKPLLAVLLGLLVLGRRRNRRR